MTRASTRLGGLDVLFLFFFFASTFCHDVHAKRAFVGEAQRSRGTQRWLVPACVVQACTPPHQSAIISFTAIL